MKLNVILSFYLWCPSAATESIFDPIYKYTNLQVLISDEMIDEMMSLCGYKVALWGCDILSGRRTTLPETGKI